MNERWSWFLGVALLAACGGPRAPSSSSAEGRSRGAEGEARPVVENLSDLCARRYHADEGFNLLHVYVKDVGFITAAFPGNEWELTCDRTKAHVLHGKMMLPDGTRVVDIHFYASHPPVAALEVYARELQRIQIESMHREGARDLVPVAPKLLGSANDRFAMITNGVIEGHPFLRIDAVRLLAVPAGLVVFQSGTVTVSGDTFERDVFLHGQALENLAVEAVSRRGDTKGK